MATKTAATKAKAANKTSKAAKNIIPDIGLSDDNREGVANLMQTVLADESVLVQKLRNYHWNVTGPQFRSLHELFEEQYDSIWATIDEIAERIRTYGAFAIGTLEELKAHARLSETPGEYPPARDMVLNILADHETMVRNLREDVDKCDDDFDDIAAEDFLTGLLQTHQEMAWMLRTYIEGDPVHIKLPIK